MKKLLSFVLAVCLMFSVTSIASAASDISDNVFYYGETEIIVEGNDLSYAEMKEIADYIASIDSLDHASPAGLICSIFGHNLTASTAIEITHNVYTTAPKCVEKQYTVETCSRCDYIEKTLLNSYRIQCHG